MDPEFSGTVASLPNPAAVRRYLARSPEVIELRQALSTGELADDATRQFVNSLMSDFQPGKRFHHEPAVAAVCVALETRAGNFAEEYTHDLAQLELAEMPTAIQVARLSLDERQRLSVTPPTGHVIEAHQTQQTPVQEAHN
ncbi:MAG TPA: hypothetical protein VNH11_11025 [Pirellulales bacterium]|nr:hypothetical protein [Pirellulales bacterium]